MKLKIGNDKKWENVKSQIIALHNNLGSLDDLKNHSYFGAACHDEAREHFKKLEEILVDRAILMLSDALMNDRMRERFISGDFPLEEVEDFIDIHWKIKGREGIESDVALAYNEWHELQPKAKEDE